MEIKQKVWSPLAVALCRLWDPEPFSDGDLAVCAAVLLYQDLCLIWLLCSVLTAAVLMLRQVESIVGMP